MSRTKVCFVVLFFVVLHQTSGVIYSLNETEYDRLPPLFSLDPFYPCLRESGDLYCHVSARLVSEEDNELLSILQEYSLNNVTHYDHNLIHWGICVTKTCRDQLSNFTDLDTILEACLNHSLTETYQLQTRLDKDKVHCTKFEESVSLDTYDIIVAIVFLAILTLNLVGTAYDSCSTVKSKIVGKFLLCFSVKRNWFRLVAPSGEGPEPKLRRLKCFNGLKTITTFFVVLGHSPLTALITSNNPQFIESTYYDPTFHVFYNGNLIVQTFFLMSGFLLAYNILIIEERRQVSWGMLPKGVVLRWLRYLAADMQMTVLGFLMFCLLRGARARKVAIGVLFGAGLLAPAVEIYLHNLHAKLLITPEVARNYFVEDPTFNHLYKRTHTNLACYAIGLALATWLHALQAADFDVQKYKKYRYVYWAVFPLGLLIILVGGIFFIDGLQAPLPARILFASLVNPLFGMLAFVMLPCNVFKLEDVYRGILEWRGWTSLGRVSYCAYLVHVTVIRTSAANHDSLIHSNFYQILLAYCGQLVITYMVAAPCWMLVEAPFAQLVKLFVSARRSREEKPTAPTIKFKTKEFDEA